VSASITSSVVNEAGLHRLLTAYVTYDMQLRTHLALEKDAPISRPVMPSWIGRIVVTPARRRASTTATIGRPRTPSLDVQSRHPWQSGRVHRGPNTLAHSVVP
jgi:hypothetical protein